MAVLIKEYLFCCCSFSTKTFSVLVEKPLAVIEASY